jgi:hypothetical protein
MNDGDVPIEGHEAAFAGLVAAGEALAPLTRAVKARVDFKLPDDIATRFVFVGSQSSRRRTTTSPTSGSWSRKSSPRASKTSPTANRPTEYGVTIAHELWQAGYDSLESFHRAHEGQRPQIRDYAAVEREIPLANDGFSLEERADVIARRLAALRHSRQPGE